MERKFRAQTESFAFIFAVIVGVVLVNLLALKKPKHWDLTERKLFTLSDGTKSILKRLKDKVVITVYFTPNQPAPFHNDERTVRDLLDEYRAEGNDQVEVNFVSVDKDHTKEAEEAGCKSVELQALEDDQATARESFRCVKFHYIDRDEFIPALDVGAVGLEYEVSSIIKDMITPEKDREREIGFLTGHGEAGPDGDLRFLPELLSRSRTKFKPTTVDLKKGDEDVPANIKGLFIVNPTGKFEEKELRKLDAYLMRGGSIALFAPGVNVTSVDMGSASGRKNETDLNNWLQNYGLLINPDVVLDPRSPDGQLQTERGTARIKFVTWPQIIAFRGRPSQDELKEQGGLDPEFPAVFRLTQIATPYTSSITVDENKIKNNGASVRVFARTSDSSVLRLADDKGNYNLNITTILQERSLFKNPKNHGPYAVGVALEGQFKSAFAGQAAPPGLTGGSVPEKATSNARLLVMSTGQPFAVTTLQTQMQIARVPPWKLPNYLLMVNAFDYLSQDTELLAVRAKDAGDPPLDGDLSTAVRETFRWGTIVGVPLLVGAIGLLINFRRRQRRRGYSALYGTAAKS